MFSAVLFAALAGSAVAAPVAQRGAPAGWATKYLESYADYHTRYVALDCADQHNTTFFEDCCHPLLSTETLSNRLAYCTPSTVESASAATVSATATDDGADAAFMNATSSVESVYESVQATATESITAVTLSTSSIAEETSTTALGDNDWAKHSSQGWSKTVTSTSAKWTAPATSTSTSSSAAATTTSSSSGGSGSYSNTGGFATYFYQNGNAGACGTVHSDSDYIIAIDSNGWWSDYASNDNSPYCGKSINIKNIANGNIITAVVADVCPTCTNDNSLDLSVGAFSALANGDMGLGELDIAWSFAA